MATVSWFIFLISLKYDFLVFYYLVFDNKKTLLKAANDLKSSHHFGIPEDLWNLYHTSIIFQSTLTTNPKNLKASKINFDDIALVSSEYLLFCYLKTPTGNLVVFNCF